MELISLNHMPIVRIDAPEWYQRKDFQDWLTGAGKRDGKHPATWHKAGDEPGEFSDVFVTYDGGDGSDNPNCFEDADLSSQCVMPRDIWNQICDLLKGNGMENAECLIWIANLGEVIEWNGADMTTAHHQGWGIFSSDASRQNVVVDGKPYGDRPFELQKLDGEGIFEEDQEAWIHVVDRAQNHDDPTCLKALRFLEQQSPHEFRAIMELTKNAPTAT